VYLLSGELLVGAQVLLGNTASYVIKSSL
jgi:hypothetical protein